MGLRIIGSGLIQLEQVASGMAKRVGPDSAARHMIHEKIAKQAYEKYLQLQPNSKAATGVQEKLKSLEPAVN